MADRGVKSAHMYVIGYVVKDRVDMHCCNNCNGESSYSHVILRTH